MFGRRRREPEPQPSGDGAPDELAPNGSPEADAASAGRTTGPWDVSEVDLEEGADTRVDLGGLVVPAMPGLELRLQVDEASGTVGAVLLVAPDGAAELRPFAAPRNASLWDDIRAGIADQVIRRGGKATQAEGEYGAELRVLMPVQTPEGEQVQQPSRVVGFEGPRWLLRATLLGKAAVAPEPDGLVESALRDVVVVRGSAPMAPGEPLPLVVPSNVRPMPRQTP